MQLFRRSARAPRGRDSGVSDRPPSLPRGARWDVIRKRLKGLDGLDTTAQRHLQVTSDKMT
jgi:hypothetical protein